MINIKTIEKTLIIILISLLIVTVGYLLFNFVFTKSDSKQEITLESKIEDYNYTLYTNATKLYRDLFFELKDILKEDEVNKELYAELISKLFIVDFYTLENKLTKNDVGGSQLIYEEIRDNFVLKASDTLYKYVENNLYGNRTQELPNVKSIEVINIENISFEYNDKIDEYAYKVKLSWEYHQDLGYQNEAIVIIINQEEKLEIVEKTNI